MSVSLPRTLVLLVYTFLCSHIQRLSKGTSCLWPAERLCILARPDPGLWALTPNPGGAGGSTGRKCGAPPSWPCWRGSCCTWWWERLFSAPWRPPMRIWRTKNFLPPSALSSTISPASPSSTSTILWRYHWTREANSHYINTHTDCVNFKASYISFLKNKLIVFFLCDM